MSAIHRKVIVFFVRLRLRQLPAGVHIGINYIASQTYIHTRVQPIRTSDSKVDVELYSSRFVSRIKFLSIPCRTAARPYVAPACSNGTSRQESTYGITLSPRPPRHDEHNIYMLACINKNNRPRFSPVIQRYLNASNTYISPRDFPLCMYN